MDGTAAATDCRIVREGGIGDAEGAGANVVDGATGPRGIICKCGIGDVKGGIVIGDGASATSGIICKCGIGDVKGGIVIENSAAGSTCGIV